MTTHEKVSFIARLKLYKVCFFTIASCDFSLILVSLILYGHAAYHEYSQY